MVSCFVGFDCLSEVLGCGGDVHIKIPRIDIVRFSRLRNFRSQRQRPEPFKPHDRTRKGRKSRRSDNQPSSASLDLVYPSGDGSTLVDDGSIGLQPSNIVLDALLEICKWLEVECAVKHTSTSFLGHALQCIGVYGRSVKVRTEVNRDMAHCRTVS